MKNHLTKIFKVPWYPFTIAAYPVLALLAYNISEVDYTAGLRALGFTLVAVTILFLILRLIYCDWHRAAFATASLAVLFFTYGHAFDLISKRWTFPHLIVWMLAAWLLLSALALAWAGWRRTRFKKAAAGLNVVSLGLVLYTAGSIVYWSLPVASTSGPIDDHAPLQSLAVPEGQIPPDIYYIIVDSYGRSDLLQREFDYDNSAFLQRLEQLGFYVADCAQSNYNRTDISMASSLNLEYLQNLDGDYQPGNTARRTLWDSISHSTVRANLENAGYRTVAFASGFDWSEIKDAQVYLAPPLLWSQMTGFETLLIRTTTARHFEDLGWINFDQIDGQRYRERTRFILNSMDDLARMPGPKFVFIHILPPHPPFIYGPDGSPTDPALFLNKDNRYTHTAYVEGYRNQAEYITGQLQTALQTLLAKSSTPPVIILQGDHAPWMQTGSRQFEILNAYFLPGQTSLLYSTISPVNSFRLVFNAYFGTHYDLLPDTSYYSPVPNIFDLKEVSNPCLTP